MGESRASLRGSEAAMAALLAEAHTIGGHQLPELTQRHAPGFGARDAVLFLVDLQQSTLSPFLVGRGSTLPDFEETLPIDSTLAGRAFQQVQPLIQQRGEGTVVVWLPLLDGTERLGVLAVAIEGSDPHSVRVDREEGARLRMFASLVAQLVVTKTLYGDSIALGRRQQSMGLAAELQWSLLPPLTFTCADLAVAAALEPAYDVAGDSIDYAVEPSVAKFAVFDGIGHGLRSAQLASMAVTAYRHGRRSGFDLLDTSFHVDASLREGFGGTAFTTALLAELDTAGGVLRWVNAGHPEPLLLRHGRLVKSLHADPRPPLGIDLTGSPAAMADVAVGVESLEPGDVVLLYTDGVTEARTEDGQFFGEQRLAELVVRNLAAGLTPGETIRRVVRALLEHQQGRLSDDATVALIQWPSGVTVESWPEQLAGE